MKRKNLVGQIILNAVFIFIGLTYILPFILLISISISDETAIADYGYRIIPKVVSFEAYRQIFTNPEQIKNSYITTIEFTAISTVLSVFITTLTAYPLSRRCFKYKKYLTWYIFFTMLFGGGLIPTYMVNTKLLHLDNTLWIYILPGMLSAWNCIIVRTFFQGIPESLVESAKIDGASEYGVFFKIMLPLSKPVMASVGFLFMIGKWNDWNTALIYIREQRLYSLQYMLQKILNETEFIKQMAESSSQFNDYVLPTESMRYATAMLAIGPIIFVFPFFQKYFTKGMTVGAVKG